MENDNGRFWQLLMIDDDEINYHLVQAALQQIPHITYELCWINNVDHALAAMLQKKYSAILLGFHHGSNTSLHILRQAINHHCPSPIIIITGEEDVEIDHLFIQAGADDFLPKSQLTSHLLERTIRHAIVHFYKSNLLQKARHELEDKLAELNKLNANLQCEIAQKEQARAMLGAKTEQLKKKNEELDQFASIVSHDLQEPLRMINGYLQLLTTRYEDKLDSQASLFIGHAVDGSLRMKRLIKDLLHYSRLASRANLLSPINLNEIIQQVHSNLALQLEESETHIESEILPCVMADETQMVQLFQNLIGNAIKYRSEASPHINITVQKQGAQWRFTIQDNGIGIPARYEKEIFLVFRQLHSRAEYGGNGIGLAICHKIVERHQGKIWLDTAISQGAAFHFTLPIHVPTSKLDIQASVDKSA